MITVDEFIKHCEEEAEKQEAIAKSNIIEIEKTEAEVILRLYDADEYESCMKCASEHRQLAEWLRELKKYEEGIVQIKELINDYKGHDMWDTANGMQLSLECLEGSDSEC